MTAGSRSEGPSATTVLRLTCSFAAQSLTAVTSDLVGRSSPAVSRTTRYPFDGWTPFQEPGRGVMVASGAGGAEGSANPASSVPTALGAGCGRDQSSPEPHPVTSAAAAAGRAAARSRGRKAIVLRVMAE